MPRLQAVIDADDNLNERRGVQTERKISPKKMSSPKRKTTIKESQIARIINRQESKGHPDDFENSTFRSSNNPLLDVVQDKETSPPPTKRNSD